MSESRIVNGAMKTGQFVKTADRNIGNWMKSGTEFIGGAGKIIFIGGAALVASAWIAEKVGPSAIEVIKEVTEPVTSRLPGVSIDIDKAEGTQDTPQAVVAPEVASTVAPADLVVIDCASTESYTIEQGDTVYDVTNTLNPELGGQQMALDIVIADDFMVANPAVIDASVMSVGQVVNIPTDCQIAG